MHLLVSLLLLGLVLSSSLLSSQANLQEQSIKVSSSIGINGNTDAEVGDILDFSDFEDDEDDSDKILTAVGFNEDNVNSVTHFHRKEGQILVPCFGMWWPVGGASYDYVGDYYGDYKKKRRRSRKQKKAAKMKKKKS